jgi:hypothetical protein
MYSKITKYKELVFFFLATLPLGISLFYAHPLLDDYSWPYVLSTTGSFIDTQILFYNTVNGRVLATLLSSFFLNPQTFFITNKIGLILYLSLFFLCFLLFISSLINGKFHNKIVVLGLSSFSLVMVFPILSTQFFWLTGVVVYQSAFMFTLLFVYMSLVLFKSINDKTQLKNTFFLLYLFVQVLSILFFEMSFIVISFFMFYAFIQVILNRQYGKAIFINIVVVLAGLLINIKAPGNAIKEVQYSSLIQKYDLSYSILNSLKIFLKLVFSLKFLLILIPHLLLLLYLIKEEIKTKLILNLPSTIYIAMIPATFIGYHFTYSFMLGKSMPPRAENYVYLVCEVLLLLCTISLSQSYKLKKALLSFHFTRVYMAFFLFTLILIIFPSGLRLIYGDLIHGRASEFSRTMHERYKLVKHCDEKICYVDVVKNPPKSILYQDLPQDSTSGNSFFNHQFAHYYGKDWVFAK